MKLTVTLELRFDVMPDGSVWTLSNFHRTFWNRYLEVFDSVEIVARAHLVTNISPEAKRVDESPVVTFRPLPFYIGPWGYLKKLKEIRKNLNEIEKNAEAVILRVGSPIADLIQPILVKSHHPYALEVVGDPFDTFAPGSMKTPLRPLFRWLFCRKLKKQAQEASLASYVTSVRLPSRYPTKSEALNIYASSIELLENQIATCARDYTNNDFFKLICVGSLEDWRKGPDTALKVLSNLRHSGLKVSLTWVGDGRARPQVEDMAQELGVRELIHFRGHLPSGQEIFSALDDADIFILPTRGEGLPRAMIEAMARGLVCVASDVGGIPELLEKDFLHEPEDAEKLFSILVKLIKDKSLLNQESQKNWIKAQSYLSYKVQANRKIMYEKLKGLTDDWKKNRSVR